MSKIESQGDQLRKMFQAHWNPRSHRELSAMLQRRDLSDAERAALMWAIAALSDLLGRDAQQTWHRALQ